MAGHEAWGGPQVSRKNPAAKASGGSGHRQRGPPCWHNGGRGSPSRRCPPLPEWHRCSSPDSPAEERAGGQRRADARVSVGRVCSACVPLLLISSSVTYFTLRLWHGEQKLSRARATVNPKIL